MANPKGNKKAIVGQQSALGFAEFGIYVQNGYNLIKAREELDWTSYGLIVDEIEKTEAKIQQNYVVDFDGCMRLGTYWSRFLVHLRNRVTFDMNPREVRLIHLSEDCLASMRAMGMEKVFPICPSIEVACKDFGVFRQNVFDLQTVVPFINATVDTMRSTAQVESKRQQMISQTTNTSLCGDISCLVTVESSAFEAIFIVSFPKETILHVASKIAGILLTQVDNIVKSVVGEVGNVASTTAKKHLNDAGYGLKVGIPVVTCDRSLPAAMLEGKTDNFVFPFSTTLGIYFIEIRCNRKGASASKPKP